MTTYLLDVNLLLALTDPMHIHHQPAHRWFVEKGQQAWATCPLTENGFVRISSHPSYPNLPGEATVVLDILRQLCEAPGHQFWTDDISIRQILEAEAIITHAQITDIYLLGLAVHRKGKLATLDQRIPCQSVRRGQKAIELVIP
jgi:toxin-antitoxin system PIN domain toxin